MISRSPAASRGTLRRTTQYLAPATATSAMELSSARAEPAAATPEILALPASAAMPAASTRARPLATYPAALPAPTSTATFAHQAFAMASAPASPLPMISSATT